LLEKKNEYLRLAPEGLYRIDLVSYGG